ncbi:MAG: hypothetical protein JWL81_264 [Verrucomicrobiales bacterium]|nr:hypothetical protein [Verrucomicrobiales bacterium]
MIPTPRVPSTDPAAPSAAAPPDSPLVVVTGLPRSGTSLVMGLLAAAGQPLLTDHHRPADPDNPRGYHEFQPVKSLMRDNTWLQSQRGSAVKIISTLLPFIPPDLPLKIILIQRRLAEVLASQAAMLARAGLSSAPTALLAAAWQKQNAQTLDFITNRPRTGVLILPHHELLENPLPWLERLLAFLPHLRQDPRALLPAIDPTLHRQKIENPPSLENQ